MSAYRFVEREKATYSVVRLCRVLGVSPSGYWAWRTRTPSCRARADEQLTRRIRAIHQASRGTDGVPRIHAELVSMGACCGRKRIARWMRRAGLSGCHRRRRHVHTTRRDPLAQPAPDLVERRFAASAPNQLWVADITAVPTAENFLYLAVILDAFSRRVVAWSMAGHLRAELVVGALEEMAVWTRQPASGVIHHSDPGSQYTSLLFGHHCQAVGIRCSMGSVGDGYDNAMAASFFATLECELLAGRTFRTHHEARPALFDYIEVFSNRQRLHSALGYLSPDAFERRSPTTIPIVP